jgi:lysophospholipase L1-like esterase
MDSFVVSANILVRRDRSQVGGPVQQAAGSGKWRIAACVAALLFEVGQAHAQGRAHTTWVASWAAGEIRVDPKDALPAGQDLTLRQLIRTTIGGGLIRLRVSNVLGTEPLTITGMHIAKAISPSSSRIDLSTDRRVTFNGSDAVSIPAGAEYESDPVAIGAPPFTTFAVSIHFAEVPKVQTGHPGSRATSYFAPGDQLSTAEIKGSTADRWYFLDGLEVVPERPSTALGIVGDSIVDGHGVISNTNTRWTDYLAARTEKRSLSVLNLGIGSNCLSETCVGPSAAARLGRDVLARPGLKYVIILEGVNDLGVLTRDAPVSPEVHHALVSRMIGALAQMTARARERGITVIGATIMPYGGSGYYHPDAANEADRAAINAWIRTPGNFDAVVDFDAMMRDPVLPTRLKKEFDSGDGLHPSPEGYRFMGGAVPLSLFTASKPIGRRR